jgi:hypothetical protein
MKHQVNTDETRSGLSLFYLTNPRIYLEKMKGIKKPQSK